MSSGIGAAQDACETVRGRLITDDQTSNDQSPWNLWNNLRQRLLLQHKDQYVSTNALQTDLELFKYLNVFYMSLQRNGQIQAQTAMDISPGLGCCLSRESQIRSAEYLISSPLRKPSPGSLRGFLVGRLQPEQCRYTSIILGSTLKVIHSAVYIVHGSTPDAGIIRRL